MQKNQFLDYPIVGENIYNSLQEWKKKYEKYTSKSKDNFVEDYNDAIENLPQITEQKKNYYTHLKISTALMKIIEKRNLEKFSVIENRVVKDKKISGEDYRECKLLL